MLKPSELLPHRMPFSLLDTAEITSEGTARGSRMVTMNDPAVCPDGIMPQVFLIEAMAQLSGIASGRQGGSMLAAVTNFTFSGSPAAGDRIDIESVRERVVGNLYMFRSSAAIDGSVIASGEIMLYFDAAA